MKSTTRASKACSLSRSRWASTRTELSFPAISSTQVGKRAPRSMITSDSETIEPPMREIVPCGCPTRPKTRREQTHVDPPVTASQQTGNEPASYISRLCLECCGKRLPLKGRSTAPKAPRSTIKRTLIRQLQTTFTSKIKCNNQMQLFDLCTAMAYCGDVEICCNNSELCGQLGRVIARSTQL